ncbi:MAG: class I SAM-dependent methyltransferase [Deltaproteobacteria bacterium]|nr:class I SAM-dependent methyltransferase [Deltaproteobacteria bacterium]
MIARGWWPLQRSLAARPWLTVAAACAPLVALAVWWRPAANLWPTALAAVVALLGPTVIAIAQGDGSRRRLAGRATGAATVIMQPLLLAAVFVDLRLVLPIASAMALAVVVPAVVPMREPPTGSELPPQRELAHARWLLPLIALAAMVLTHPGLRIAVPALDAYMIATVAGCTAIWIGVSMRPLLGLTVAAATLGALAVAGPSIASVSPMTIALALTTPLVAWFQRESSGGFPLWTPAAIGLATVTAYAQDPAWPVMGLIAALTWLITALYPAHTSVGAPTERGAAGIIAWSQRLFAGLEPYWRFYARAKLASDPIYARLAAESRTWGSVLDAGCGPGLTAAVAAGRADTTAYLGIDLDLDKLLVARRALHLSGRAIGCSTWRLRRDSFPLTKLPPDRFDTVLLLDVLHYWPDDVQAITLAQLASLLQPTGRLYLREGTTGVDGDAGHIERGERFTTYFGLNPENALTFLSPARIAALIEGAGLTVESDEPMGAENRLWVCRRI